MVAHNTQGIPEVRVTLPPFEAFREMAPDKDRCPSQRFCRHAPPTTSHRHMGIGCRLGRGNHPRHIGQPPRPPARNSDPTTKLGSAKLVGTEGEGFLRVPLGKHGPETNHLEIVQTFLYAKKSQNRRILEELRKKNNDTQETTFRAQLTAKKKNPESFGEP